MTILRHELKQNRTSFWIWTVVISFMIGVCVFIYPEMKGEMESISDVFANSLGCKLIGPKLYQLCA